MNMQNVVWEDPARYVVLGIDTLDYFTHKVSWPPMNYKANKNWEVVAIYSKELLVW